MLEKFYFFSPIGQLELCVQDEKLVSVLRKNKKITKTPSLSVFSKFVKKQLEDYFQGNLRYFQIPLSIKGKPFQKKVWQALQQIPWGQTKTYGQIALEIKCPKGARAVGSCCARNPLLIVVPCHRVVSQKALGGFALGIKAKKTLLHLEQF